MASPTGKAPITNIWMVTGEYEGLVGAGGVKDVSWQLAEALARKGRKITVVLPLYGFINPTDKCIIRRLTICSLPRPSVICRPR